MGRGDDSNQGPVPTPAKRKNPLERKIKRVTEDEESSAFTPGKETKKKNKNSSGKSSKKEVKKKKKERKKEKEVKRREAKRAAGEEALSRWEEDQRLKLEELARRRLETTQEKALALDRKRDRRKNYLQKEGLSLFSPESPAGKSIYSLDGTHPDDYEVNVINIDDPLLQEDGKSHGCSVSLNGEKVYRGFASSESGARGAAYDFVRSSVADHILRLREEEEDFIESKEREKMWQEEKKSREELVRDMPLSQFAFVDRTNPWARENYYKRIVENKELTSLSREEVAGFSILVFRRRGRIETIVSRGDRMYFDTDQNGVLRPIDAGEEYKSGGKFSAIPQGKSAGALEKEAERMMRKELGQKASLLDRVKTIRRQRSTPKTRRERKTQERILRDLEAQEVEHVKQQIISSVERHLKPIASKEAWQKL